MATAHPVSIPAWFRIIAVLAICWNAFGVVMYLSSVGLFGDPMAGLDEADRAAAEAVPGWITAVFAIGTFGGLAGSVGLFMRKAWAKPLLLVSLLALVVMEGWIVFLSGALESFGVALPIVIVGVAIFLVWLAAHAGRRGWLA